MSARDLVHHGQFAFWMSGGQIQKFVNESRDRSKIGTDTGMRRESMKEMWDRKLEESRQPAGTGRGAGTYKSIATHGWDPKIDESVPIMFEKQGGRSVRFLGSGHHRVAAAADLEKKIKQDILIPVDYVNWGDL